jgi:hypothetical protein
MNIASAEACLMAECRPRRRDQRDGERQCSN